MTENTLGGREREGGRKNYNVLGERTRGQEGKGERCSQRIRQAAGREGQEMFSEEEEGGRKGSERMFSKQEEDLLSV